MTGVIFASTGGRRRDERCCRPDEVSEGVDARELGEDAGEERGRDLAKVLRGGTALSVDDVPRSGGMERPGFDEVMGEGERVDGGKVKGGADGEGPV